MHMARTVVLAVLDGWGIGEENEGNPIHVAKPPRLSALRLGFPLCALQASGIAVGLPWGEEGNSEVGHLVMGAGKVLYQYYPRISLDIRNGGFFKNPALLEAAAHVKENNSALHLAGLMTESNIHASLEHLRALVRFAKEQGIGRLYLHLFSDGKDSRPRSALELASRVRGFLQEFGVGEIASLSGRFYALDRAGHWNRTQAVYEALTGGGPTASSVEEWVRRAYADGLEDEFITPALVGPEPHPIRSGDALVFFDFRADSIRELAGAFLLEESGGPSSTGAPPGRGEGGWRHPPIPNLFVATMTTYADTFPAAALYPQERIELPLGRVLANAGKVQLRVAEAEKYPHVTFFFNGYRDEPFRDEYRILVPSGAAPRVDAAPEMMASEVGTRVVEAVEGGGFDFVLVNFANADLVAHTGNFDATAAAALAVDREVGRIAEAVLQHDAILLVSADHGHAERMRDPLTGAAENRHAEALVPFILVGRGWEAKKSEAGAAARERRAAGILADVAPTVLELLGIPKPNEMTGESLLPVIG